MQKYEKEVNEKAKDNGASVMVEDAAAAAVTTAVSIAAHKCIFERLSIHAKTVGT